MRWKDLRRSQNVRDLRNQGSAGGRGGLRLPIGGKKGGLGFIAILAIAYFVGGPDTMKMLLGASSGLSGGGGSQAVGTATPDDETGQFMAAILGSTEDVWGGLFSSSGERYKAPELTLFRASVSSACGSATSASGPFYCPADQRVYLDTAFFDDLARMGGAGDFAQAYVIGHEVGHHVQTLLGTNTKVRQAQSRTNEVGSNKLQVAMELQADCFAGVWAHHANKRHAVLEPGDVDEGMNAAAAIGDDRLQRGAGRQVTPDSFTHGSSAARQKWLRIGLESGDPSACDTFG